VQGNGVEERAGSATGQATSVTRPFDLLLRTSRYPKYDPAVKAAAEIPREWRQRQTESPLTSSLE